MHAQKVFSDSKLIFILIFLARKFLFDFWGLSSVFGLWRHIFVLLTPKCIYFLTLCKILDRWIYLATILIFGPKFRFWALKTYLRLFDLKGIFFFAPCKISKDGYITNYVCISSSIIGTREMLKRRTFILDGKSWSVKQFTFSL
jgi:hypothetical protein